MAWSPDHHQIVYRVSRSLSAVVQLPLSLLGVPDASGDLMGASVNGSTDAIQISPTLAGMMWSGVWWNASANPLLYRELLNSAAASATV